MITANIQFLTNNTALDLSRPPHEVKEQLQKAGIITPPNMIMLDNARTLRISLYPEDSMGERILSLVNTDKNMLGEVNSLCHHINCMDYRDEMKFTESIDSGKASDLREALKLAEKLREQRRIKNKKKEQER